MQNVQNYINGEWQTSDSTEYWDIPNPATGENIARVPFSSAADIDRAAEAALEAYPAWRRTPANDRAQYLYKYKTLLEDNANDIARIITSEAGKTFAESVGELRR